MCDTASVELLTEFFREPRGDDSRYDVGSSARRKRHDDAPGPLRPFGVSMGKREECGDPD
jgi:hypothetical protein